MNVKNILKNRIFIVMVAIIALLLGVALVNYVQGSKATITGTLTLNDASGGFKKNQLCQGSGGYDDIQKGTQVTVRNGSNNIIAVSELGQGTSSDGSSCTFNYSIEAVPRTSVYQIEISHRGGLTYSRAELVKRNFTIDTTLGS